MADFFVSYNHADKNWAEWIAWELQQVGYTTVIQAWDFPSGSNFVLEMHKGLSEAARTIAVLSPDYLKSNFTQPEWASALADDPTGTTRKLVPIRVRQCVLNGLLRAVVYIDLVEKGEAAARRLLLDGINQGRRSTAPRFPNANAPRFPGALPAAWNIPHLRNPHFTGRGELLDELRSALTSGRPAALTQAISGLGGVGKTSLAVEYAYRNASDYSTVWWVRAEEPATLSADFSSLARKLGLLEEDQYDLRTAVDAIRHHLSRINGWLLVFDNAPSAALCEEYLPYGATGHIIITSRDPNWKSIAESFAVQMLRRDEAVAFFLKRMPGQISRNAAGLLCEELGGLPLALEHAAAYMEAAGITISQYLRLYRNHTTELLGPVATTWALSFERIQIQSPEALELINLFAFLAPDEIPRELARKIVRDDLALTKTVAALRHYSLIEANTHGLTVHRLVQAAARERLRAVGQEAGWAERALQGLYRLRSLAGTARLLPHVLVATGHTERLGVGLESTIKLLTDVGLHLRDRSQLGPASQAFERALRVSEKTFGSSHESVAASADNLARVLQDRGETRRAVELARLALDVEVSCSGPDHARVSLRAASLSRLVRISGDLEGALRYAEQALKIDERIYGANHPKIAVLVDELSSILHESDDLQGALRYALRTLQIDQKNYGSAHAQVAIDENNIGVIYEEMGNRIEARRFFESALAALKPTLEADDRTADQVTRNLALLAADSPSSHAVVRLSGRV